MQSADPLHLFQSDASHAKAGLRAAKSAAFAKAGNPINLKSKPLRVVIDSDDGRPVVWVAESNAVVSCFDLETGKCLKALKGHTGPVTAVEVCRFPARKLLLSGSWDKSVKVWDTKTSECVASVAAHDDFVKAMLVVPEMHVLLTASSDKTIRAWDLRSLASAPTDGSSATIPSRGSYRNHTRPIERMASCPLFESSSAAEPTRTDKHLVFSVDSMGCLKTWVLSRPDGGNDVRLELKTETKPHETAIYDIKVGIEDASTGTGEVWTASADNSVLQCSFSTTDPSKPPVPLLRIPLPAHTKSVLPLHLFVPSSSHVLAGSSDDLLRVIDESELDGPASLRAGFRGEPLTNAPVDGLVKEIEGHAHDIVDLYPYEIRGQGIFVLSASIDGSLRRWPWPDVLSTSDVRTIFVPVTEDDEQAKGEESVMTAEEERELAELMDD